MTANIEDYNDKILDVDEIAGTDIKVNPDYYFHTAILKCQEALADEEVKRGMLKYRMMVEHLEALAKSSKRLTEDYHIEIEKFKTSDFYLKSDPMVKDTRLAHKRFELILSQVFSRTVSTDSLKV